MALFGRFFALKWPICADLKFFLVKKPTCPLLFVTNCDKKFYYLYK